MTIETTTALTRPAGRVRALHANGHEYDYAPGDFAGLPAGIFAAALAGSPLERYARLDECAYAYCTVEAVGYGTAAGMVGEAVPLVVLAAPDGARVLVPARLVDVYLAGR